MTAAEYFAFRRQQIAESSEKEDQKLFLLGRVDADEKDRNQNIRQIEAGTSWATIHWLVPLREYGKRSVRAETISGQVKAVLLDRAQIEILVDSRSDEIAIHNIGKGDTITVPLDSVTSVSL